MIDDKKLEIIRSGTAEGLVLFYNLIFSDRGWILPPHLIPVAKGLMDDRIRNLQILIGPGGGKALHPDTKVLTPKGWIPIKNLSVGDSVTLPDGKSTAKIRGVFFQEPSQLYKLTFSDGRVIRANKDHLWKVYNKKFTRDNRSKWRLRTTEELSEYIGNDLTTHKNETNSENDLFVRKPMKGELAWYVPLVDPIESPEVGLPLPPYLMGCLLGDGSFASGTPILTCFDKEMVDRIRLYEEEYDYEIKDRLCREGVYSLKRVFDRIRDLKLEGTRSHTKFIPDIYMNGSLEQRWELIRGLFDTDGTVDKDKPSFSFCTTSPMLRDQVQQLIWSVGGIAYVSSRYTQYTNKNGDKVTGKLAYNIQVRHPDPSLFFHLSRKKERARKTQYSDDLKLRIVSIEKEVEESPSVCINIDHPDGLFIVDNYIVTHNSVLISVIYPLYKLALNPDEAILGISAGESLITSFIQTVMEIIDQSPVFKMMFPNVRPDKNMGWSLERGMFVTGRKVGNSNPSYWGSGIASKALVGKHGTLVVLDDIHDDENSRTVGGRDGVLRVYRNTIIGRSDPRGTRFVISGRRWHPDDIYGTLEAEGNHVVMVLPAERPNSELLYWDVTIPDGLVCCFNEGKTDVNKM